MNKARSQTLHTFRRAQERYSINLGITDLVEIKDRIKGVGFNPKTTIFVDRQSNRLTRWKILYKGEWLDLVYDSKRHTIVTLLPKGSLYVNEEISSESERIIFHNHDYVENEEDLGMSGTV